MKKSGILHAELSKAVARMGHGDIIVIGDIGVPFPRHEMTTCIDLAITKGVPKVTDVLKVVLEELVCEEYIVAQETKDISPDVYADFKSIIDKHGNDSNELKERVLPHIDIKDLWLNGSFKGEEVKVFVRAGDHIPYCYIALAAGVSFS